MKTLLFKFFSLLFLRQEFFIDFVDLGLAIYTRLALNSLRSTYSDSLSVGSCSSCEGMWIRSHRSFCWLPSCAWGPYDTQTMKGQAGVILTECFAVLLHSLKKQRKTHIPKCSVLQKNRALPIILCCKCRGNLLTSQKSRLCFYDEVRQSPAHPQDYCTGDHRSPESG